MISLKHISKLTACILFFLFFFPHLLLANDKGQIININRNFQIAFTDLGNKSLKHGDIVKVYLDSDGFVYMQVLESSAILTKLGISKVEGFQTSFKDFQRIAIGNTVAKVNGKADPSSSQDSNPKAADEAAPQLHMQKMEQDLNLAKEQIQQLKEANAAAKARLSELTQLNEARTEEASVPQPSNPAVLDQIKIHIDNMQKIINETN
jgi:hypothetical protein